MKKNYLEARRRLIKGGKANYIGHILRRNCRKGGGKKKWEEEEE
jgi:hypothetical protein